MGQVLEINLMVIMISSNLRYEDINSIIIFQYFSSVLEYCSMPTILVANQVIYAIKTFVACTILFAHVLKFVVFFQSFIRPEGKVTDTLEGIVHISQ